MFSIPIAKVEMGNWDFRDPCSLALELCSMFADFVETAIDDKA